MPSFDGSLGGVKVKIIVGCLLSLLAHLRLDGGLDGVNEFIDEGMNVYLRVVCEKKLEGVLNNAIWQVINKYG